MSRKDNCIAVIGLGTMGAPMAANLMKAGREVIVHNRSRAREEKLASRGAARAGSPAEAARSAAVVLTCVSDTADLEEVLLDGETGAIAGIAPGGLVIDCSTISPAATRRMAAAFAERGVGYVDAPVSGGSEGAIRGTLAIMCGGAPGDFERARPVLEVIGGAVTRVGDTGAGQVAKAVNQVIISGTYQAVAEGLALATRSGVSPRRVVDAIRGGAAASWVLDNRAENMIENAYPLGFRVSLHRKDLGIALDEAAAAGVDMPVARLVAAYEDELIADGWGDEDMSALARLVRSRSRIGDGDMEADTTETSG